MINNVHRLDEGTINKIAAGEVIERPASVVKELVENSIDAGADRIEIEIKNGGRQLIRITDNGCGMEREDAVLAIERHTTSKIQASEDLEKIKTLGFRGEALSAIAAVSQLEILTKPPGREAGTYLEAKAGLLQKVNEIGIPDGTTVKVRDLFYNTPARLKYLKSIPTEAGYITEILSRLALGYPGISIRLQHHQYEVLFTPGKGDLFETMVSIYGKELSREALSLDYQDQIFKITGFIGKPSIAKTNRNYENFYINGRYFRNRVINAAVEKAFHTLLPIARYPFVILFLEVEPALIDVNVHPAKLEVRFSNESDLFRAVHRSISQALKNNSLLTEWNSTDEEPTPYILVSNHKPDPPPVNLEISYQVNYPLQSDPESEGTNSVISEPEPAYHQPETERKEIPSPVFYVYPKSISDTYIIVEDQKGLLFIDQHAAHERLLYEKYFHQTERFLGSQALLIPETVNLNYQQYKVVADRISLFNNLGFELEAFGGQTVIIRAVPLSLVNLDYGPLIIELIEQYLSFETFKNPAELKEAFIITMACRSAVKAGDSLTPPELENLVKELFRSENPYTCPHGRPTVFRLGNEELARKFLRR